MLELINYLLKGNVTTFIYLFKFSTFTHTSRAMCSNIMLVCRDIKGEKIIFRMK